jgi:ABC-type glycerol-3-phosphate transport system substrate-binding protein
MSARLFGRAVLFSALVSLTILRSIYPASGNPELEKAKTNAQSLGYTFIGSHDEILAGAKREGKLRVLNTLDAETTNQLIKAFREKYPFISVEGQEVAGTEGAQRFLLEMQPGKQRTGTFFICPVISSASSLRTQGKLTSLAWHSRAFSRFPSR